MARLKALAKLALTVTIVVTACWLMGRAFGVWQDVAKAEEAERLDPLDWARRAAEYEDMAAGHSSIR